MHKISFIGAGNMGGALIRAACKAIPPEDVLIYDTDSAKTSALAYEAGCDTSPNFEAAVSDGKFLVFCVKPQVLADVLADAAPGLQNAASDDRVLVSIAAGITLDSLYGILGGLGLSEIPVIRAMPNIPASVGRGTLLVVPGYNVSRNDCAEFEAIFTRSGIVERTDEHTLNLGTAICGCVPAFAFMFIEALADGGVAIGMSKEKALLYAAQTVAGAADMILATGEHPAALKDAVCSPGGSTIAGVMALERGAFRSAVAQAVIDSNRRNIEMGQSS